MTEPIRETLRNEWPFEFTPAEVLVGAKKKFEHHKDRLAFWETSMQETREKIKNEGLEFDESLANLVSNSYSRNTTVNVRPDLLNDLNECIQKTQEHRAKKNEYHGWVQALTHSSNPDVIPLTKNSAVKKLYMTIKDWQYFFGE